MRIAFLLMIAAGVALGLWFAPGQRASVAPPAEPAIILTPQTKPLAANAAPAWRAETVLTRAANGHFYTDAAVNGRTARFVVDTGATGVALTIADAQAAGIAVDRSRFEPVGMGAGGEVRGQRVQLRDLMVEGKRASDLSAVVIDGLPVSLLGQTYLRTLNGVEIKGDTMVLR